MPVPESWLRFVTIFSFEFSPQATSVSEENANTFSHEIKYQVKQKTNKAPKLLPKITFILVLQDHFSPRST